MRLEIGVWLELPSVVKWAFAVRGITAATLTIGHLAAMGLRVRRVGP